MSNVAWLYYLITLSHMVVIKNGIQIALFSGTSLYIFSLATCIKEYNYVCVCIII